MCPVKLKLLRMVKVENGAKIYIMIKNDGGDERFSQKKLDPYH